MADPTANRPTDDAIHAAYFYLMARALAVRQELVDIQSTPYNAIKYNPLGSSGTNFVNPNMDVAYWEAWIAVDEAHAVVMHVPEIRQRYYTVQVMDGWGEVVANVNERNFPQHPHGRFAFVRRGTHPAVPPDALVIELPCDKAKVLARVELSTTPDEAVALQRAFTLDVPEGIRIDAPPPLPPFPGAQLPGAWIFDGVDALLASCPDGMPDAPRLQGLARDVASYAATGPDARRYLQGFIDGTLAPYFQRALIGGRPSRGGWTITDFGGRYGDRYEYRALVNLAGIWANVPEEVVYYTAHGDAAGVPLDGGNRYRLRFAPDALPRDACRAFWSVTMLRQEDYRVAPNPLNRYTISSASGAALDADGSLTLHIAPDLPEGVPQQNWLPAPKATPIVLTFRLYVPTDAALAQTWFVPPLERAEG